MPGKSFPSTPHPTPTPPHPTSPPTTHPTTHPTPPWVSNPDMHHGTCVTHMPWCLPGTLTSGCLWSRWRGKGSHHSRRMRNPLFYVSGRRSMFCIREQSMAGIAAAMVIYTRHEKSCTIFTMHGNLVIFQNVVFLIFNNHNDESIANYHRYKFLNYPNHTVQLFSKLLIMQLTRILIWYTIDFIENYRPIFYLTNLYSLLLHTFASMMILFRFSYSNIVITSQCTRHMKPCINFLQCIVRNQDSKFCFPISAL